MSAIEIRPDDIGGVDEIVGSGVSVHLERMNDSLWCLGLTAPDGEYWQFWLGAKNSKSHVEVTHSEHSTAGTDQG